MDDSDDIHAALALMYGYAARYAPSTVIEARIDALVVWYHFHLYFLRSNLFIHFGEFNFYVVKNATLQMF